MTWEAVIGLEVHTQLQTRSKIFSGCKTDYGAEPNTQACEIDLGMPGVLPVINREAVRQAIKFGLAIGAKIPEKTTFDRKNYFYPDLPKGYQISQHTTPVVIGGDIDVQLGDESKRITLHHAHLEEDAGKSLHDAVPGMSGIDLNRAGTPLLEIVSNPDMRSAAEAVAYLKTLHALVVYLGICDGNMQEGSFRCDANVSVRRKGDTKLGTRTETKNVNSFRFVERAINFEIERQIDILEDGGSVAQETRLYDADKNETRAMRSKEEANDYRYFPDPDLLPIVIDADWVNDIKQTLPELPHERRKRFESEYGLSTYDANILTSDRNLADYYEAVSKASSADGKLIANWMNGELASRLNKQGLEITECPIAADAFALLLDRIADHTISGKIAKTVFEAMWDSGESADSIIEAKGLKQMTDTGAIEKVIDEVLAANPEQLAQFRDGKEKLFGFFVGAVMKATQGKANPATVNDLLKRKLQG